MNNEWVMMATVTEVMHDLGIPANLKGHKYLRDAIMMSVRDVSVLDNITKMYKTIAADSKTTHIAVERAMRTAIGTAWKRGNMATIDELFGYTINSEKGKPTNSEFIALIADKLRMDSHK